MSDEVGFRKRSVRSYRIDEKMSSLEKEDNNTDSSGWNIVIILSCLGLIVMFDETMILPAIPDFIRNFNISYSTSSWLLSAYIIAAAVMTPIGGFCCYKGLDLCAFTYHSCFTLLLWPLASSYSYYSLNPYSFHSYG